MNIRNKATSIRLADFSSAPMRAFHMAWLAFFLCFFSWFGVAPLMPVIRNELHLTKAQTGNSIIASVALAVLGRLLMGWLCDRIGPRKAHTWLLILGSLPVMGIGLAHSYTTFLIFRLTIGMIPSSTRVGNVDTHAGSDARTAMPLSKSNLQPCNGQTTAVPDTIPSHKGPPL